MAILGPVAVALVVCGFVIAALWWFAREERTTRPVKHRDSPEVRAARQKCQQDFLDRWHGKEQR